MTTLVQGECVRFEEEPNGPHGAIEQYRADLSKARIAITTDGHTDYQVSVGLRAELDAARSRSQMWKRFARMVYRRNNINHSLRMYNLECAQSAEADNAKLRAVVEAARSAIPAMQDANGQIYGEWNNSHAGLDDAIEHLTYALAALEEAK